jgi:hypothetical protein
MPSFAFFLLPFELTYNFTPEIRQTKPKNYFYFHASPRFSHLNFGYSNLCLILFARLNDKSRRTFTLRSGKGIANAAKEGSADKAKGHRRCSYRECPWLSTPKPTKEQCLSVFISVKKISVVSESSVANSRHQISILPPKSNKQNQKTNCFAVPTKYRVSGIEYQANLFWPVVCPTRGLLSDSRAGAGDGFAVP